MNPLLLFTFLQSVYSLCSSSYEELNKTLSTASPSNGHFSVMVFLVSLSDTKESQKYRIPYSTSFSLYPNHLPASLLEPDTLGPSLPDYRIDPIAQVNEIFRFMSSGKISFHANYSTIHLRDVSSTSLCSEICEWGEKVLQSSLGSALKSHELYDISVLVFPQNYLCTQKFVVLSPRVLYINGYEKLRRSVAADQFPSLTAAFGALVGFQMSYLRANSTTIYDPLEFNRNFDGIVAMGTDFTDLMGSAEVSGRFTNPSNYLRAGWMDRDYNCIQTIRTGLYRIWPLHNSFLNKFYTFPWDRKWTVSLDLEAHPYQRSKSILMPTEFTTDYTDLLELLIWTSNERSNFPSGEAEDFSYDLLMHLFGGDESFLFSIYESPTLANSVLRQNQTMSHMSIPCDIKFKVRDWTSTPVSQMVHLDCSRVEPDFTAIKAVSQIQSAIVREQSGDDAFVIYGGFETVLFEIRASEDLRGMYIAFARSGTQCRGSNTSFHELLVVGDYYLLAVPYSVFDAFDIYESIAMCSLESYFNVKGPLRDEWFVQQNLPPFFKDIGFTHFTDESDLSACTFCSQCALDTCDVSTIVCDTEVEICSCFGTGIAVNELCCNSRGNISDWTNDEGAICECSEDFTGKYCNQLIGNFLLIDTNVGTAYLESKVYLHIILLAPAYDTDVTVNCSIFNPSEEVDTFQVTFSKGSNGNSLWKRIRMQINSNWAPSVTLHCESSPLVLSGATASRQLKLNVINSNSYTPQLTSPEYFRVTQYHPNGTVDFAWDPPYEFQHIENISYSVVYKSYAKTDSDDDDCDVVVEGEQYNRKSTLNTFISIEMAHTSIYTVRLAVEALNERICSRILYVIPGDLGTIGERDQKLQCGDCTSNGICGSSGICSCDIQKYFHGPNCELDGCHEYNGAQECSGHGNCEIESGKYSCECEEGYFGFFCELIDWMVRGIEFQAPLRGQVVNQGDSVTLQWKAAYSTSRRATLYYKHVLGSILREDDFQWKFVGDFQYKNGSAVTNFTVTEFLEPNSVGFVLFWVRDDVFINIAGEKFAVVLSESISSASEEIEDESSTTSGSSSTSFLKSLFSGTNAIFSSASLTGAFSLVVIAIVAIGWFLYRYKKQQSIKSDISNVSMGLQKQPQIEMEAL